MTTLEHVMATLSSPEPLHRDTTLKQHGQLELDNKDVSL